MAKRRERDRPKAGPDAAYDPNKRILLSYGDSDEEGDVPKQLALDPRAYVRATPSVPEPEGLLDAEDAVGGAARVVNAISQHGTGSNRADNVDNDDEEYDPEEAVAASYGQDGVEAIPRKTNPHPGRNTATNQKPALGSLAFQWDEADDEEGYGTAEDEAMAYLRAVRQERQSMPSVFRAMNTDDDANLYELGDDRGYYDEDCYIARPLYGPGAPAKTTVAPRDAYTSALKVRFNQLHCRLQQQPDTPEAGCTGTGPLIPQPQAGDTAYTTCLRLMREAPPHPLQLQSMSQESVFATLGLIDKHYLHRSKPIGRNTSAWIFALLARLDEVGAMDNDKVSALRELGKRAVIVQISFKDAMTAAQLEGIGDDKIGRQDAPDKNSQSSDATDLHNAKIEQEIADSTGLTEAEFAGITDKENTLATLDMILAVVGEIFGQRDLLEFRRSWEPDG